MSLLVRGIVQKVVTERAYKLYIADKEDSIERFVKDHPEQADGAIVREWKDLIEIAKGLLQRL